MGRIWQDIITTAYLESPLVDSGLILANTSAFSQTEEFSVLGHGDGGDDQGYADPGNAEAWHGVKAGDKLNGSSSHQHLQVEPLGSGYEGFFMFHLVTGPVVLLCTHARTCPNAADREI